MDNGPTWGFTKIKLTWKIENFSKLSTNKLYSQIFHVGAHPWRILLYPNGNNSNHLSIYLYAANSASLPRGWSKHVTFTLAVINLVDSKMTVKKETQHKFNARESGWGFAKFVLLSELCNPDKGYLANDTCIIDAEFSSPASIKKGSPVHKAPTGWSLGRGSSRRPYPYRCSSPASTTASQISGGQAGQMEVPSAPIGELIDFRGLGKIEKVFVQILEDVCSKHPSLIECQQKRSRQFIEWAFTALGRVLHFLQTKRVKDMNDEACMDLQNLWEELETFKFDLTWLEPHVQSALSMKNYQERAMRVKKLKENVDASETKMKNLKEKLAAGEVDLETARRDLVQAQKGFEERDIDAELGYETP